jgi:glycosyltransferase involved in cell wall biosynthesis
VKILLISNKYPPNAHGGWEISAGVIAKTLVGLGHHVVVATSKHRLGPWKELPEAKVVFVFGPLPWYNEEEISLALRSSRRRPRLFRAIAGSVPKHDHALAHLIATERPELILVEGITRLGPLGVMHTCLSSGVPTIFHFQDQLDWELHSYATRERELDIFRQIKTQACAVSCSQLCAKYSRLIGTYAVDLVEPTYGPAAFAPAPAFHSYSPDQILRVFHAGTLCPDKGTALAVEGFVEAERQFPGRMRLQLIGHGDDDYVKQLLHPGVEVPGAVDRANLLEVMTRSHVAILPLRVDEPMGLVSMEAVRSGCISLIGANVGPTDVTRPFHNYIPLYSRTPSEIARWLEKIVESPQDFRALAAHAWKGDGIPTPEPFMRKLLDLRKHIPAPDPAILRTIRAQLDSLDDAPIDRPSSLFHY